MPFYDTFFMFRPSFNETQVFYEMQPLLPFGLSCLTEALEGGLGQVPQTSPDWGQQTTLREAPCPGAGCLLPSEPLDPIPALCQDPWVVGVLRLICCASHSPSSAVQS